MISATDKARIADAIGTVETRTAGEIFCALACRALVPALSWVFLICAGTALALTFPTLSGRVVDEAGLLSEADRANLNETLAALEAKTTAQLVVVTLKTLQGISIEEYGNRLGRYWKVGQKDKNNGVLLIVVPNDRIVRIEVGYGLEGTLTDALTKATIEIAILPRFRTSDFAGGINNGVTAIARLLTGDDDGWRPGVGRGASPEGPASDGPVDWTLPLFLLGMGLLIVCAMFGNELCIFLVVMLRLGRPGSSRGGGFGGGGGSFGGGGSSGRW